MNPIDFTIAPDGRVHLIYGDDLPLPELEANLGPATITRASEVEPAPGGGWQADMARSGGPLLPPTLTRAEAVAAEVRWLQTEVLHAAQAAERNTMEVSGAIQINRITYAPISSGNRHVVVVDRGWIFAGNLTQKDGRIKLEDAVMVLRWESIGFDGMIGDPKSNKVTIKRMPYPVDLPEDAELFRISVPSSWGL